MLQAFRSTAAVLVGVAFASTVAADEKPAKPTPPVHPAAGVHRPVVPGDLVLNQRRRSKNDGTVEEREVRWKASETAVIVCDMWDDHYCQSAAQRVGVLAPKLNAVLTAARNHGVLIVHAPSGCMEMYEATPYRQRMKLAAAVKPPVPIGGWCHLDPKDEGPLPIDDAVSPCDDPIVGPVVKVYSRQHPAVQMHGFDGCSDSGVEMYNYFTAHGVKNVVMTGVHTNMCVLGRPFGIRQLVRLRMNVALARDLTDAMYDPRQPPYVSHARGTELVVEHIEKYWCPSIESGDLTKTDPRSTGPREADGGKPAEKSVSL
ncbi:MAG: protein-signal peptide and transmembrane prediction [Planctomycetia bacterium]